MPATVIYDADCGICTQTKRAVEALDLFGAMRWIPQQSPEARQAGIPMEEMQGAVQWLNAGVRIQGYSALKRILACLPLFWIAVVVWAWLSPWTLLVPACFFAPVSNPIGNRAYAWVARNRYRFPGSTCAAPSALSQQANAPNPDGRS
jgi:predicted DCC family thiol-disulfide oxidoreductase YuxK